MLSNALDCCCACGTLGELCLGGVPNTMLYVFNEAIFKPMGIDGTATPAPHSAPAAPGVVNTQVHIVTAGGRGCATSWRRPRPYTQAGRPEPIVTFSMLSVSYPDNLKYIESTRSANKLVMDRLGTNCDGGLYTAEDVTTAATAACSESGGPRPVMFDYAEGTVGHATAATTIPVERCCCCAVSPR